METATLRNSSLAENTGTREPEALPVNILAGALKYADMVEGTDAMMPFDKAVDRLYARMGWR